MFLLLYTSTPLVNLNTCLLVITLCLLCFKDVLLGENNGFGLVKDPCYLAGPGSRYVSVFMKPSTLWMLLELNASVPLYQKSKCDIMMFHSVMCHPFSLSRPWGALFFIYRWLSLRMILFKIGFECVLLRQWLTSSKFGIRIVDGYALLKYILWLSHVGPLLNVADLFWLCPRGSGLLNKAVGEEWASWTAFTEQDKLAGITWSKK